MHLKCVEVVVSVFYVIITKDTSYSSISINSSLNVSLVSKISHFISVIVSEKATWVKKACVNIKATGVNKPPVKYIWIDKPPEKGHLRKKKLPVKKKQSSKKKITGVNKTHLIEQRKKHSKNPPKCIKKKLPEEKSPK